MADVASPGSLNPNSGWAQEAAAGALAGSAGGWRGRTPPGRVGSGLSLQPAPCSAGGDPWFLTAHTQAQGKGALLRCHPAARGPHTGGPAETLHLFWNQGRGKGARVMRGAPEAHGLLDLVSPVGKRCRWPGGGRGQDPPDKSRPRASRPGPHWVAPWLPCKGLKLGGCGPAQTSLPKAGATSRPLATLPSGPRECPQIGLGPKDGLDPTQACRPCCHLPRVPENAAAR